MKKSLSSSEWSLLAFFAIVMGSLVFIAKVNVYRAQDTMDSITKSQIEYLVTVVGAVKKPGEYRVPKGTSIENVLRKAQPTPFANLKTLPLKEVIHTSFELVVEELKEICVHVDGSVIEPVEITMPARSRISDLKSKVALTEEGDKSFFRRRKLLRDGDKIWVPKKRLERN